MQEIGVSSQRAVGKFGHRPGGVRGGASRKERRRDQTYRQIPVQRSPDILWTDGWMCHQVTST